VLVKESLTHTHKLHTKRIKNFLVIVGYISFLKLFYRLSDTYVWAEGL